MSCPSSSSDPIVYPPPPHSAPHSAPPPAELVVTVALDRPVVVTGNDLEVPESSVLKERRFKDMAKVRPETRRS